MNIKDRYQKAIKTLMSELNITNLMAVPKLQKVVVNIGFGKVREQSGLTDRLIKDLAKITGQKPIITKSRKSIAGFKVQKNQAVGFKVTLRGKRMYDFIDRLLNSVLPAIRDFRGLKSSTVDQSGNLQIGLAEHTIFPEIGFGEIEKAHGIQITMVPDTRDRKKALALYKVIGVPLQE